MILHRYILSQVLWPILAAFLSLNLLFLMVQLLKVGELAAGAGIGFEDIFIISGLSLPLYSIFTIPISVLTGVLLGFGRMASDRELVAFAGAGIPSSRLMLMPVLLGLLASLMSGVIVSFWLPIAASSLQRNLIGLTKRNLAASLDPGVFYEEIPGVVLYPNKKGPNNHTWNGFLIYEWRMGTVPYLLVTQKAKVRPARSRNVLEFHVEKGQVHSRDGKTSIYSIVAFDRGMIGIDVDRLIQRSARFVPPTECMSFSKLIAGSKDPNLSSRERRLYRLAWHRRIGFSAAGVLFAFLGTALGATGKLRGRRRVLLGAVTVVSCYYLLIRLGDAAVQNEVLNPVLSAWMPDVLVAGVAFWWMRRRRRMIG